MRTSHDFRAGLDHRGRNRFVFLIVGWGFLCFFCFVFPRYGIGAPPATHAGVWEQTAGVRWTATPMKESLARFAELRQISILLDRRVDPSTPLNFEATNLTVREILEKLSASYGLQCCFLDSSVYIGPPEAAKKLDETLKQRRKEIDALPPGIRAIYLRKSPLKIPFLGQPKEILRTVATQNGLHWKSLDPMPHDVWSESSFPAMPLFEQWALILIGFDGTFGWIDSGSTLILVPVETTIPHPFPLLEPQDNATSNHAARSGDRPKGNSSSPPSNVPLAKLRFTVQVKDQRLDAILQSLAEQFGYELVIDEKSLAAKKVPLDTRVSFNVKNVSAQELLRAILDPLKLRFRFRKETLQVE